MSGESKLVRDGLPDMKGIERDMKAIVIELERIMQSLDILVDDDDDYEYYNNELDIDVFMLELKQKHNLEPYLTDHPDGDCKCINWNNFGPVVDDIILDLYRLKRLNIRTNRVVRRLQKVLFSDDEESASEGASTEPGGSTEPDDSQPSTSKQSN